MIIKYEDAWGEAFDPKTLPKPDYSHISPNIVVGDAIPILFEEIYIDDDGGNIARSDGIEPSHIENLKLSFSNGVDTTQQLGAVEYRGPNYAQPYVLKYGYGRSLSQLNLGWEGWFFNPIEATETQFEDVQSYENEDPLPKSSNKEKDIINIKVKQIREGRLTKNEDVIIANLKKTYPTRKKESLSRIAAAIFESTGTPVKYAYYTEAKIKLWRTNHSTENFNIDGNWDSDAEMYGYTTKIGGIYRTWHRAKKKYAESGAKSDVNCFTGVVSKGATLRDQRSSIVDEYIALRVREYKVYGKDVKFLTLNGYFPQEVGTDNWKSFVLIDQDKLEKLIKAKIKATKSNKVCASTILNISKKDMFVIDSSLGV